MRHLSTRTVLPALRSPETAPLGSIPPRRPTVASPARLLRQARNGGHPAQSGELVWERSEVRVSGPLHGDAHYFCNPIFFAKASPSWSFSTYWRLSQVRPDIGGGFFGSRHAGTGHSADPWRARSSGQAAAQINSRRVAADSRRLVHNCRRGSTSTARDRAVCACARCASVDRDCTARGSSAFRPVHVACCLQARRSRS